MSKEFTFEDQLQQAVQQSLLKIVKEGGIMRPDYANRIKVPMSFMQEVWKMVDLDKVKEQLAVLIQRELAEKMVNKIAAEMSTDIKQILSISERREALRAIAREHIDAICKL